MLREFRSFMAFVSPGTIWLTLAVAAGGCIAMQAAANGALRHQLGDARYAGFFSICGTMLTAILIMLALRPTMPSLAAIRTAPWWMWIGGPLGTLFVLAGASLTPKLGAASYITAAIAGQVVLSLLLDHFGLMNVPQQGLTLSRMAGGLLVVGGVLLVRYG
jgi:bacterial/archaeal transporter family-2 protein